MRSGDRYLNSTKSQTSPSGGWDALNGAMHVAFIFVSAGQLNTAIAGITTTGNWAIKAFNVSLALAELSSIGITHACYNNTSEFCRWWKEYEIIVNLGLVTVQSLPHLKNVLSKIKQHRGQVELTTAQKTYLDEILDGVPGVGKLQNLLSKLDNYPHAKAFVSSLDEVADVALINKLDDFIEATPAVRTRLNNYLNGASTEFKAVLRQSNGIDAWKLVDEAISPSATTQFAKDPATLSKVSAMISEGSGFRRNFPTTWEDELRSIVAANVDLRCVTCGNLGITRVPPMDQMLANVEHILQFSDKPGFSSVMTNLKSNVNNRDGIHHMITYMKNNADEFVNVLEFEFRYADDILNKADVLVGSVKYEFKSWTVGTQNPWKAFFGGTGNSYTQFIRYLENSTDMSSLKYVFNGGKATESQVKLAFKELFQTKKTEIFEVIWENQSLRNDLFGVDVSRSDAILDFDDLILSTDSKLYDFIKSQ